MNIATEQDRNKIKQYLKEATKCAERIKDEQSHARDILKTLKEDHDIVPVIARKAIAAMLKGNAAEIQGQNDDFADLIEIAGNK